MNDSCYRDPRLADTLADFDRAAHVGQHAAAPRRSAVGPAPPADVQRAGAVLGHRDLPMSEGGR